MAYWDGKERRMNQSERDLLITINANLLSHLDRQKHHEEDDDRRFSNIEEKINTIYKNIVGTNGSVGLKTDVELLKEAEKDRKESKKMIWTAMIGTWFSLGGKVLWDMFKR